MLWVIKLIINLNILFMEQQKINALVHVQLLARIEENVRRASFRGDSLPQSLVNEVLTDDNAFSFLIGQIVNQERKLREIPIDIQRKLLALAQKGQFGALMMYITVFPFDFTLHRQLWRIMIQNRNLVMAYIQRWTFEDSVLDRFWESADDKDKVFYVVNHEVTKKMGLKVWEEVEKNSFLSYCCKLYLQHHPVPQGLLSLIVKEDTKVYDLSDLIEYSNVPFYPEDEITLVSQDIDFLKFYLKKFGGLSAKSQVALLSSGDDDKIRYYAEQIGIWDSAAQKEIVSSERTLSSGVVECIAANLIHPFEEGSYMALCEILSQ